MTRAERNHNPLNIRRSSDKWQGLTKVQLDPAFFQFESDFYGFRAAFKVLYTYFTKYGCNTIRKIITRWAPPSENNTERYISGVASYLGIPSSAILSFDNIDLMVYLVRYMARIESGKWYDNQLIRDAYLSI